MEYYLAIKRKKNLIYATTWMNLENMNSGHKASHRKTHITRYHLYDTNECIHKVVTVSQTLKINSQLSKEKGGREE